MPMPDLSWQHREAGQQEHLPGERRDVEPVGDARAGQEGVAVDPVRDGAGQAAGQGLGDGAAEAAGRVCL